ncbi:MAG TPA: tetratricopeptide repeat protein [Thermoanaerobaculia bacterium]|nr:tetratricopeptide repeat protein [Thermoanaerobaculia bacterium]
MISMIWNTHARAAIACALLCALPEAAAAQDTDPFGGAITATDVSGQVKRPAGRKAKEDEIQSRYRKILAAWAGGQTERAAVDLMALETSVVSDEDPGSRKRLLQAEQAVIHEVGAANLETLVPIAMLHHEVYRRYLLEGARGHALVLGHARGMTRDLAILYREQSGSEGAALVSSRILTSLGGMLQQAAQQLPAADMFQLAAEMDPRNTAALIGLATVFEKNTRYEPAVETLRSLLAADPNHAEAKLRLAVNLHRLEKTAEAVTLLQELAADKKVDDWVSALAAQELADVHREKGKLDAARAVLEAALQRFPNDPRFYVQLASVLDRAGQTRTAQDVMEKLPLIEPRTPETAARFLYNTVRPETFQEARRFLDENAQSRLPVLAQALDAPNKASVAVGVAG